MQFIAEYLIFKLNIATFTIANNIIIAKQLFSPDFMAVMLDIIPYVVDTLLFI